MKSCINLILLACIGLAVFLTNEARAQEKNQATWIWYPGDYSIWLGNQMQNRRTERGAFFPPFWRLYSHYIQVDFRKDFTLAEPEEIEIHAEGDYNIKIDSKMLEGRPEVLTLPAGTHTLNIKVYNQAKVRL